MSDSYKQNRKRFDDEFDGSKTRNKKPRHNEKNKHKQGRLARHNKELLDELTLLNGKHDNMARNQ